MALLFLLCCVLFFGTYALSLIIELLKGRRTKNDIIELVCMVGISIFFACLLSIELEIMMSSEVVVGTTKERCRKYRSSNGIEINYNYKGKSYTECVGYNFLQTVNYPNIYYKVKVSRFNPERIRVDFSEEMTEIDLLFYQSEE